MTERPIIFSGEMVRAILDDRKTQTRRVLKGQPLDVLPMQGGLAGRAWCALMERDPGSGTVFKCKYGQPGDRLRVRETWWAWGHFEPTGELTESGEPEMTFIWPNNAYAMAYALDYPGGPDWTYPSDDPRDRWHKRPAIFLPSKYSRLTLAIVSVRVERVQDISNEDALAEGIDTRYHPDAPHILTYRDYSRPDRYAYGEKWGPRESFRSLWDSINGKKAPWSSNVWVWVLEFQPVEPPSAAIAERQAAGVRTE